MLVVSIVQPLLVHKGRMLYEPKLVGGDRAGETGAGVGGLGGEAKEKAPGEKGFTLKDDV